MLVVGRTGMPVLVFPTSGGRFYEFEDCGMIGALAGQIDAGELQIFCVDSVNAESWYNQQITPWMRIARHLQYERYLLEEALPLLRELNLNSDSRLLALGCSFGGYHAVNLALRHPDLFSGFVSLSGTFDLSSFLDGFCDEECYLNLPTFYLPNLTDPWYLDHFKTSRYLLASGWDDPCLAQNQGLDRILTAKAIPHDFYIWETQNSHDWPTWRRMVAEYL